MSYLLSNPSVELEVASYDSSDVTLTTCQLEQMFKEDKVYNEFLRMLDSSGKRK